MLYIGNIIDRLLRNHIDEIQVIHWISYQPFEPPGPGPLFTKNLKSDRNRKPIPGAKMCFTKNHNLMITSVLERK